MFLTHRMRPLALACTLALELGAQDAEMEERLYLSGERAYATRAYAEAFETWGQLLQAAPKSLLAAQALLRMARHRLETEKKPDEAMPLLDRLKAEHLQSASAAEGLLLRGRILASRSRKPQDLREAIAEFNRVLDLFPDHPAVQSARYQLGLAYRMQGQWGRALQNFADAMRLDPASPVVPQAQFQAAEVLDILGDLPGCLRLLQGIRNRYPQTPEAAEAAWRIAVRVKLRIQKAPMKSQGPWPQGKQKWLKTPTLLATDAEGRLIIYQDDLDQAFLLQGTELVPASPAGRSAKVLVPGPEGKVWTVSPKTGLVKPDAPAMGLGAFSSPTGAFVDGWKTLWVGDSKASAIGLFPLGGEPRTIPSPSAVGLVPMPDGGAVLASDTNRALLFLDASGQPRLTVPYGRNFPAPFRYVLSLCSDPLGDVAAIVDGDFEGVAVWGPDGTLLRCATFKALGLSGKFRAVALDRQGCLILADRTNDVLIRVD